MANPACIQNTNAAPIKNHTANNCSEVVCVTYSLIASFIKNQLLKNNFNIKKADTVCKTFKPANDCTRYLPPLTEIILYYNK